MKHLFTLLLLLSTYVGAQHPAHYFLGEQELSDVNVYSIFQPEKGPLLVATNKGLYQLKKGKFELIEASGNQVGKAVFDLTPDKNGDVYCINLNGQVFKFDLAQESLSLHYVVPGEYLNRNLAIEFDDQNNLWIGCKRIIMYDGKNEPFISSSPLDEVECMESASQGPGRISITTRRLDTVVIASSGQLSYEPLTYSAEYKYSGNAGNSIMYLNSKPFLLQSSGQFTVLSDSSKSYSFQMSGKYSRVNNNEVWLRGGTVGAEYVRFHNDSIYLSELLFPSEFISCVYKKEDGLIVLGTFGSGLIVIPKLSSLSTTISSYKPIYLTGNDENQFVVTRSGQIHHFHYGQYTSIIDSLPQVSRIFHVPRMARESNRKLVHDILHPFVLVNDTAMGITGLKAVNQLDSQTTIMAATDGVFKYGSGLGSYDWEPWGKFGWKKLKGFNSRSNDVIYDPASKKLVVASNHRVILLDQDGGRTELTYKNRAIDPSDLAIYKDVLICGTIDEGLMLFKNGKLQSHLTQKNGLIDNSVRKIQVHGDDLFVLTSGGLQLVSFPDLEVRHLGEADGIIYPIIEDFLVGDSSVYFLADNKLNFVRKSAIFQLKPDGKIFFSAMYNMGRGIKNEDQTFDHDQNHLKFYIDYRDIQFLNGLSISYRLVGLETSWSRLQSLSTPIEYKSLGPGEYTLEVQPYFNGQPGEVITYSFEIKKPYWTSWWYYLILLIISVFVFYIIYRVYHRWKLRRAQLKGELATSKLTAIQSQMNPHFIFNALNSIQDLVLKGDKKNSYTYISKFASLVRRTLNYSDKDLIELSQEVKLIELYLTIEKLRFKENFSYELDYPESEVLVPPMIVQPFIENALVHGLLHKEGLRELKIRFRLEEQLICEIIDNGVGRAKAEEIKVRQRGEDHESFSVKANSKRFELLTELYKGDFGYSYVDLMGNGTPSGTKVILRLPEIKKF